MSVVGITVAIAGIKIMLMRGDAVEEPTISEERANYTSEWSCF
jgi:hypothetical protein